MRTNISASSAMGAARLSAAGPAPFVRGKRTAIEPAANDDARSIRRSRSKQAAGYAFARGSYFLGPNPRGAESGHDPSPLSAANVVTRLPRMRPNRAVGIYENVNDGTSCSVAREELCKRGRRDAPQAGESRCHWIDFFSLLGRSRTRRTRRGTLTRVSRSARLRRKGFGA